MSLDGAHLSFINAAGVSEALSAKGRKFVVGSVLGSDLLLTDAERVHCEIQCDAYGRVTIYNHSRNEPILLNDQVVHAKRPLFHGARIKILNEVYTWNFPKVASDETGTPDRPPPEKAANSSPTGKGHRPRRQFDNRLTVHNFRYSINSDDEGNTSIESRELEISSSSNNADTSTKAEPERSITPPGKEADETLPKVDLLEATQNKENTSTLGNKLMLQLCARSDVVITSFSPRETGVKIEKSFTCVKKPSTAMGITSAANTPKSVYNTPKSVLSELNEDSCSRDLLEFSTPSTSKKALAGKRPTSMYLIDLTTPQKLRPTLNATPKQTPGSGVSTNESSDSSVIVIDITNSSTPSTTPAKQHLKAVKTPREQLLAAGSTPKRTPQSLMKRALLTSAKKKITANTRTPTTPMETTHRQSLLEARRQCLTAPRRLPFHPQPQWRTPGRRHIAALDVKAPQTSPRKRQSMSVISPRENKNSRLRRTLAANARKSPNVDMSNKLVAKARRALNSPKQDSPKRIGSPKARPIESSTPDRADNSNAELSRTFTIDDDEIHPPSLEAITASIFLEENEPKLELEASESSLKDKSVVKEEISKLNESKDDVLNRTFDLNESQTKSNTELTADVEELSDSKTVNDPVVINKENDNSLQVKESKQNLDTQTISKSPGNVEATDVIEDSICEEVPTPPTCQEGLVTIVHLAEDTICEEVPTSEHETSLANANADSQEEEEEEEIVAPPGHTPIPRRSSRRFSNAQNEVSLTPRRSSRRASIDAKSKLEQCIKPTRRASCSATIGSEANIEVVNTPKRKRRLTEELLTPTRKSQRLLCNTPKRALQVDESVGDMGVIIEEDAVSADKLPTVTDEDYGTELPIKESDETDRIDYHGMRELLKTPKSCSTPHFKGLREMIRTPKVQSSPMLGDIKELLETSSNDASTPKRSVTVSRVTLELTKTEATGDAQDMYFKTPSGKNLMIPNDPASAVLKSFDKSLATTTEYDLNATNATLHLDKIFDDVLATETETTDPAISVEDSEHEINVTAISTAVNDPLSTSTTKVVTSNDSVRSEALMNISHNETANKDPLTSTAFKKGAELQDEIYYDRPKSPGICDVSGIQMLDRTTDSMFSEPLIVTGVDSCDVTLEETKATNKNEVIEEGSDTDSMVGLSEPLVLSDDEADVEEVGLESPKPIKEAISADSSTPLNETKTELTNQEQDKNESHAAEEEEKSIDLTEDDDVQECNLDNTEKREEKNDLDTKVSTADASSNPIESAEESFVTENNLIEEKSIDLTEEDDDQECILDNTEKKEQDTKVSIADISTNQIESELESEITIDLESSSTVAALDESTEQTEVTRTSTIYGPDLSQRDETLELKAQPSDESILESSTIQDIDTNEADSIIELNASNDSIDLDEQKVAKEFDVSQAANDTKDNNDIQLSAEELPAQIEAIEAEKKEEEAPDTINNKSVEQLETTKQDEAQLENVELITSNNVQAVVLNSKIDEDSLIKETNPDNAKSKIELDNTELDEAHKVEDIATNVETGTKSDKSLIELPVKDDSLNEASSAFKDESLLEESSASKDEASTSDLIQKEVQEDATLSVEESPTESQEKKANSDMESKDNEAVNEQSQVELKSTNENAQLVDETEKDSDVVIESLSISNTAEDKLVPEVLIISSEETSSKNNEDKINVEATNESAIDLNASEMETSCAEISSSKTDAEESLIEMNASVVDKPENKVQHTEIVSTSSGKDSNESNVEIPQVDATNLDDSIVELDASLETESNNKKENLDKNEADSLLPSANISSNQDEIESQTQNNLESTNADESLVEIAKSDKEEKHSEEQLSDTSENPLTESDKDSKPEATNIDDSVVELDASVEANNAEKNNDDSLLLSADISSNQDDMESTNAEESLVKIAESDKEDKHPEEQLSETSENPLTEPDNDSKPEATNIDDSLVELDTSVETESNNADKNNDDSLLPSADISSNQHEMESTNAEESEEAAADVAESEKAEELSDKQLPSCSEKPLTEINDEIKSQIVVETTNVDDSLAKRNVDKTEMHLDEHAAEISLTSAELAANQVEIETKNAEDEMETPEVANPKKEEEHVDEVATEDKLKATNAEDSFVDLESENAEESLIEMEKHTQNSTEVLSTSIEVPLQQVDSSVNLESTTAKESLIEINTSEIAVSKTEEEHNDKEAAEVLSTSDNVLKLTNAEKSLVDLESTNVEESVLEINTPEVAAPEEEAEHNEEEAAEVLSTSVDIMPKQVEGENKSEVDLKSANADESLVDLESTNVEESVLEINTSKEAVPNKEEEHNDEEAAKQIEIEKRPEVDLQSTNADESLIEEDAVSVAAESKEENKHVEEQVAETLATSVEIMPKPAEIENATGVPEIDSTENHLEENTTKTASESAETEMVTTTEQIPESISISTEKSSNEVETKSEVAVKAPIEDDFVIDLDTSDEEVENINAPEISSTSADKSLTEPLDRSKAQIDVSVKDKDAKENVPVTLPSLIADDLIEEVVPENDRSLHDKSSETISPPAEKLPTETQDTQDQADVDSSMKVDGNDVDNNPKEEELDSQKVSADDASIENKEVSEPVIESSIDTNSVNALDEAVLDDSEEKRIEIDQSTVEAAATNDSMIKQASSESSTVTENPIQDENHFQSQDDQNNTTKTEENSPKVPSKPIEDKEEVIDLDASCEVDLQSVEEHPKEKDLAINKDEESKSVEVETSVDNTAEEMKTSKVSEEETKTTQVEEVIESQDKKPADETTDDANKSLTKQVESQDATEQKEISTTTTEEPTNKPKDMVIDLISSDEDSTSNASIKVGLEKDANECLIENPDTKANSEETTKLSVIPETEKTFVSEMKSQAKSMEQTPKKGRTRKPSTLKEVDSTPSEMLPTKRSTRKASVTMEHKEIHDAKNTKRLEDVKKIHLEEVEEDNVFETAEEKIEIPASSTQPEKLHRRVRKSTEVAETEAQLKQKMDEPIDLIKSRQRGRKPSAEVEAKTQGDLEKPKGHSRGRKVVETKTNVEENKEETLDVNKPKRRGRKQTTEVIENENETKIEETVDLDKDKDIDKEEEKVVETEKPKRRGRKQTTEVIENENETKIEETVDLGKDKDIDKEEEKVVETEKPKRRGRKPSAEVVETKTDVEEKLKPVRGRGRNLTAQVVEVDSEIEERIEKPTRRGRKPSAEVVEHEDKKQEAIETKRRGRKPSAEPVEIITEQTMETHIEDAVKEKPKRRNRKGSAEVTDTTESSEQPERKSARNTRKASAETVECESSSKEHLAVIDESDEPDQKKLRLDEPTHLDTTPAVKRRGRKPSVAVDVVQSTEQPEIVQASASRRGRKATTDEEAPTVQPVEPVVAELKAKRRGCKPSASTDVESQLLEATEKSTLRGRKPSADVVQKEAEPIAAKKTTRRARVLSTNVEINVEEAPHPKKTTTRRGRKASLSAPAEEMEKPLDVQTLPTQPIEPAAIVCVMISPKPNVHSSEDELTPRRREARNLPRKNYDETSDEDKPGSSRRKARKPVATKTATTTTTKPAETEALQPTSPKEPEVEPTPTTPVMTQALPEPTSSQKREGRNMPRKNYSETSDDEKPTTSASRSRRIRQPTIKALELLVDTSSRPATPKRRAAKAKQATENVDEHAEEPPEKKLAVVEEASPVPAKARGGTRRKAQNVEEVTESESVAATPVKRVNRNRKESPATQTVEPEVQVEEEVEQKQPVKRNARGANSRKAKIVADEAAVEEKPVVKKPRGGARAKTPAAVEVKVEKVAEVVEEPKEVPATKKAPPARARAARGVKVAVDEAEIIPETAAVSRTGRGRKVHFETTEDVVTAPKEDQPATRATRSRRK